MPACRDHDTCRADMWIAARIEPRREALALHCLALNGYATYLPRIRERRMTRGRKVDATPALFPGYAFVEITLQWHAARWSPGVAALIMAGDGSPARVPDKVISDIRARERNGFIMLPPPLRPGDRVRVTRGPLEGLGGLCAGMAPRERVLVLLSMLGARRQVTLPAASVEAL